MLIEHRGKRPSVDPSAYVAPPAVLCGDVLVGPHAHVNGSVVGDGCFLATGSVLFPESRLGNPARVLAPWDHDEIWRIQQALDFPGTV